MFLYIIIELYLQTLVILPFYGVQQGVDFLNNKNEINEELILFCFVKKILSNIICQSYE